MTQPASQSDLGGRRAEHPPERTGEMSGIGETGRVGRAGDRGAIRQVTRGTL
jgi:hypothetical protein